MPHNINTQIGKAFEKNPSLKKRHKKRVKRIRAIVGEGRRDLGRQ